jgi:hypothetical protein
MKPHPCFLALAIATSAHAQVLTRTSSGKPALERPTSATGLAVDQAEATRLFNEASKARPEMSFNFGVQAPQPLMRLRGEYHTSLVVEPTNGRLPYTSLARENLAESMRAGF